MTIVLAAASVLPAAAQMTVAEMFKERSFVIEAERIVMPDGSNVMVSSLTNFLSVDGENAVIQISPLRSAPGPNGVGGLTVDGKVSKVQVDTDRRHNLIMTMMVTGSNVSAYVTITVPEDGTRAMVRIDPSYTSEDLTLMGQIVPLAESEVHQGLTL